MNKQVQELTVSIRQRINELYSDVLRRNMMSYSEFLRVVLYPANSYEQYKAGVTVGFNVRDIGKAISIRVDHDTLFCTIGDDESSVSITMSPRNVADRFLAILIDSKVIFNRSIIDDLYHAYVEYTNVFFGVKEVSRCQFISQYQLHSA